MGTLEKDGSYPLIFDGRPESWPFFKKALHQLLDNEGYGWVVEGGDVFCAMLQAASAKAAKSTVTSQGGASQRSPSLPLQCRQCRSRGKDWVPDMQVYGFLRQGLVNRSMITRDLNFGAFQLFIRESSGQSISYVCSCMCLLYI
jgi:hypothetical protein